MPAHRGLRRSPRTSGIRRACQRPRPYHRRLFLEGLEERQLLAAFTPGNLVAYRVGFRPDESPPPGFSLTGAAAPVFLDEIDANDFSIVNRIPLPTAVVSNQRRLTASGNGATEGMLTRSANGQYLLLTGYDAAVGTSSVTTTTVNRVVGRVDAQGNVDTSTLITTAYVGNGSAGGTIRSVASVDGTTLWTAGVGPTAATSGVHTLQFGDNGATTQLSTTATDIRDVSIVGSQLFVSTPSASVRLGQVGNGLPTSAGQTIVGLPGIPDANGFPGDAYQFFAADLDANVPGPDTLYVADSSSGGVIRKFSLLNSTWIQGGNATYNGTGIRGLTGLVNGNGSVTIYATTNESNNQIFRFIDSSGYGGILSGVGTTIDTGASTIAYRGLTIVPIAPAPATTTDVSLTSGNLVITDTGGDDTNDNLTISRLTGPDRIRVFDPNNALAAGAGTTPVNANTVDIPLASVSGGVQFNTLGGNDSLTVDLSGGNPIPPGSITFNGGPPTTAPGDKLLIVGGNQGTVTYNYTNAHDGSVVMSNYGTVNYTGLEPIVNSGTATDVIFNLPAGANVVTLGDDGTAVNGLSRLSAATFETTDFSNPAGSLTINRGSASDTLTVNSLPDFNATLAIGSAAGPFSALTFAGPLTLAANRNLSANAAGTISLPNSTSTIATNGTGSVSLTTARDIRLSSGSSIATANGGITLSANQQAPTTAANFKGILVNSATLATSGTGNISLLGRGGNDAATSLHIGVHILNGVIQSTAVGAGAGMITLTGQGGAGTTDDDGVVIEGAASQVVSVSGNIQLTGTGGSGSTTLNRGVAVISSAQVKSTSTGASAANITIAGTGGTGTDSNIGVDFGTTTVVATVDGDVNINGQASSLTGGQSNYGLHQGSGSQIKSTGTGASAGQITISGTGGGGTTTNQGVRLESASTDIASVDGNVSVTGIASATTGAFQDGVRLVSSAGIHVTGTGTLTMTGTAGSTSGTVGVGLRLGGTSVSTISLAGSQNTLSGDRIVIDPANLSLAAGGSTVTLRPATSDSAINLGSSSDTAVSTLELSDSELDAITAEALAIGDATSGTITVSANLTQPAKNLALATSAGLAGSGDIINGSATATTMVVNQAGNSTYSGRLGGPSGGTANDKNLSFTKQGAGTLTMSGASSYTGITVVSAGRLNVTGSITSNVTVASGATLGGTGTVNSANTVNVQSGGTVAPGLSPGVLNTGSVSFTSGSIFNAEVNGTTAGSSYDQLNVTGTVNLGGATLITSGTIGTPPGTDIVLINNDGTDPVIGTFSGLAEGALVTINGVKFFLTYAGGTNGNDVVLKSPDLRLTSVVLSQAISPFTATTPVVGEQVFVHAFYEARNLPATASYRLEARLDGVPISLTRTSGAGVSGTTNWNWVWGGWFASPGTHSVQLTLDADNSVAEVDETNNVLSPVLTFTAASPITLPQKFLSSLGGVPYYDWSIINYYDVNPAVGPFLDYQGGPFAYDGHDGHDLTLPNFARMDAGAPEYAAADGTVESVADGNFDRNTAALGQPANFIVINHGNGWKTQYYHLATNTITVQVGDVVTAGQLLGLAGSSGNSTLPHLHFGVTHNGALVEPDYDPADYEISPLQYQGSRPMTLLDWGTTNFSPTSAEYKERPAEQSVFSLATPQNVVFWFRYSNVKAGDQYQVKWYHPDGTLRSSFTHTAPADDRGDIDTSTLSAGTFTGPPGAWRVAVEKAGIELGSKTFLITAGPGAAGIKVTAQDGTLISDNRTTAYDFGTVPLGGAAISRTFSITNHGTAQLTLANLLLPSGFALSGAFPSSIPAAGSMNFTVNLLTAQAGSKFGSIQFITNDPETPAFNFNVSGTVSGAAPAGAPVLSLPKPALAYTTLGQASVIDSAAAVADADSASFSGGSLTVEFTSVSSPLDSLGIRSIGSGAGQIGVSGSSVTYGGIPIGVLAGGTSGTPLVVNLNAGATPAAVQELLRNITFSTTATKAESLARYVRFTLVDDAANTSNQPIAVVIQNMRPTTVSLDASGNLVIADISGAGKNDTWQIDRTSSNLRLTDLAGGQIDISSISGAVGNGSSIVTVPLSAIPVAGKILVNGREGTTR